MTGALTRRQMIPPITARTADGRVIWAWDYKQKSNLVIAFLHADCAACGDWLARLGSCAEALSQSESVGLIVYAESPRRSARILPMPLIDAADMTGHSQRASLGRDAFNTMGLCRVGAFVADRYGELDEQWVAKDAEGLPSPTEILSALWQIEIVC
jgi:hypothetical protein